jgi:4-amino-4-deoxy-L-arabinose transferase-like glycosyltransferase
MQEGSGRGEGRREWLALAAILGVALFLRLAHLQQIAAHDPFFDQPSVDGRIYDFWARQIVAGDWMGGELFVMGPLYPYWIALVYGVFGESLTVLKVVQTLLGVVSCGLVWALGRLHFGARIGLIAAAMAAVYEMLIFYGGAVMVVNVQVPLILCVLILTHHALKTPTAARWLVVGIAVGLSALARQTALIFSLLMVGWILIGMRAELPAAKRWLAVGGLVLGVALVILPVTARNRVVTGETILVNAAGATILYMSNGPDANGSWATPSLPGVRIGDPFSLVTSFWQLAEREQGRPLSVTEMNAYWTRRTLDAVLADPLRWLRLEARKLMLFTNAYEIPGNRFVELSREFSWVHSLPLLGFGVMAPLAIFGLYDARGRWRRDVALHAMLLSYLASALTFYVISRFRMPAAAVLMIFAAVGLSRIHDAVRARDRRTLMIAAAIVAASAVLVHQPPLRHSLHVPYYNLGYSYALQERWDDALAAYEKSLRIREDAQTREAVAKLYEGTGRRAEAIDAWRSVVAVAKEQGDEERAARARARLAELDSRR